MEVKGRIIQKLDPQSGTSKAGNQWKKQEYILETLDNFPRKICFDFFGERADQYPLNVGDMVNLSFDIESAQAPMPPADAGMPQPAAPSPMSEVPNFSEPQDGDDLPF